MAKALLGIALWLCIALSVSAASPAKKQPSWAEIGTDQQQILAPLASRWDGLNAQRKSMWLGIAKSYPTMTPGDQDKVQRRMQTWVKLSSAEKSTVREGYKKIQQLPPDKKQTLKQKWDEYESLPEEERRKLSAGAKVSTPATKAPSKPKVVPTQPSPSPAPPPPAR